MRWPRMQAGSRWHHLMRRALAVGIVSCAELFVKREVREDSSNHIA